ncbi:replication protein, repA [Limosilactobacillus pontis]|uniref:Replication protein, repA n=1 Tax=Limosilactobacillus pontis TaxID=35787 RepID=A0ABT7UZF9_9LACO|nr:replication protein, repA [Limosilactobacillus pontis]MDM8267063.1 replication protein, repA [Limosilactobacillus pontis]
MGTSKAFLGINLDLIENPKYNNLDSRAMMLYALYADRSSASLHNARLGNTAFVDNMGVFIRFTNELAAKVLHTTEKMISKFRKQLADCGLIKVVRDGLKGYKIYVAQVEETPANTELILPWKNHYVETVKVTSSWTTFAKLEFCKSLVKSAQTVDTTVKSQTATTNLQNGNTSLTPSSLTTNSFNHNGLVGNAHAREASQSETQTQTQSAKPVIKKQNPYHLLPDSIKKSFNRVFGFITAPVAIELQSLIKLANEDMLNYAITSSEGRKITSPINYLKAAITNAIKRGAKCVQDMINYYDNQVKNKKTQRGNGYVRPRYMSEKQAQQEVDTAMEQLRIDNPQAWLRITQKQKAQSQSKPLIPIYSLGE